MHKIINAPDGREFVFDFDQILEFEHVLFSVLNGSPKKVEVICSDSAPYNVVYKVSFL